MPSEPPGSSIPGCEVTGRRVVFTLRPVDVDLMNRSARRAGCSIGIWLRGLVEARLADERALERELARIEQALAREEQANPTAPARRRSRPYRRQTDPSEIEEALRGDGTGPRDD